MNRPEFKLLLTENLAYILAIFLHFQKKEKKIEKKLIFTF